MWKRIKDSVYEVSNKGEVRNSETNRIVKSFVNPRGYCGVGLFIDGVRKRYRVHRLVAQAFLEDFDESLDVHHINGIRHDNRVENLQCLYSRENQKHKKRAPIPYLGGKETIRQIINLYKQGLSVEEIHTHMRKH